MSGNINRWFRHTMVVGALFALSACAASLTNIDQKLATGEKGVVIWAVEVQSDAKGGLASAFLFGGDAGQRYGLIPGFVPRPPDNAPSTYTDAIVNGINGKKSLRDFERDGKQVRWYAAPVDPGEFTLAYIDETAQFATIGFNRGFITPIGTPIPGTKYEANVVLSPDTPNFTVAPGETVYVGTFVGKIQTAFGGKRAGVVTKDYEMVTSDRNGITKQLKINPAQVRSVDLFSGHDRAWKQYLEPERAEDG